jgi:acetyltransferase-like isoleucine patch superfamily enzyme
MSEPITTTPGQWTDGMLPGNVHLGEGAVIRGDFCFRRFRSGHPDALVVGRGCTMDGVQFAIGETGRISIGDNCYFTNAILLCELEVRIGNFVMIGWNTTIADSDFHPIAPAERLADAVACSPLGNNRQRPPVVRRAVVIQDDVYIGPASTILKGVTIGAGAWIEPGAMVTADVPAGARVLGNPARVVGPAEEKSQ